MNEALNQKISQFIDDELDYDDALNLLQKMQLDADLIDTMNRYQAISHSLKSEVFLTAEADFSARISEQIRQEPAYLLAKPKTTNKQHQKLLALAASAAAIAILTINGINSIDERLKSPSLLQVAQPQQPEQISKPVVYVHQTEQYPLNKRINDYLQAHNSSLYTNTEAPNFTPLTSVTTYNQK